MRKKKSVSGLPSDFYTNTMGSNYGFDGFNHDVEYKGGLELPRKVNLSNLPEGFSPTTARPQQEIDPASTASIGFDFSQSGLISKEAGLASLEWLEFVEQDPNRLPKYPHDRMQKELEEAWGVNRRTTGIQRVEMIEFQPEGQREVSKEDLVAQKKLAFEKSIREVTRGEKVSTDNLSKKALQQIEEDRGLLGNVFIKAAAYPQCGQGKWKNDVSKYASSAKYVQSKKACGNCTHNQENRCEVFKKEIVNEVPWQEAYQIYLPILIVKKGKIAKKGSYRETLKSAFLAKKQKKADNTLKTVYLEVLPSSLTFEDALKKLKTQENVIFKKKTLRNFIKEKAVSYIENLAEKKIIGQESLSKLVSLCDKSPSEALEQASTLVLLKNTASKEYNGAKQEIHLLHEKKEKPSSDFNASKILHEKGLAFLASLEKANLVSQEVLDRLKNILKKSGFEQTTRLASHLIHKQMQEMAAIPCSVGEVREYQDVVLQEQDKLQVAKQNLQEAKEKTESLLLEKMEKAKKSLIAFIENGTITKKEAVGIIKKASTPQEIEKLRNALLQHKMATTAQISKIPLQKKATYRGEGLDKEVSGSFEKPVLKKATIKEIDQILKWTSQQITEGIWGDQLDELLTLKFSSQVLEAAKDSLNALREEHEGLAGNLYVHASAYATPHGTKGCDVGGSKQRMNNVPYVLEMERCDSCVFRNANNVCQKYRKELVKREELPQEQLDILQEQAIEKTNMTDAEALNALYSDRRNPVSEFGLSSDMGFTFSKEATNPQELDFIFGGLHLNAK